MYFEIDRIEKMEGAGVSEYLFVLTDDVQHVNTNILSRISRQVFLFEYMYVAF